MITASMVKELRELTGAGMLDCKKALEEANGNLEKAAEWLREKGISKAAKKAGRIAAEGLVNILIEGNKALVIEVNSETDFVAKNDEFKDLIKVVKIDADKNVNTAKEYGVFSLPSVLIFKDGEVKEVMAGLMPKSAIISNIKKLLN